MEDATDLATNEEKTSFMLTVIAAEEMRRDSIETKSEIMLAANAVLLGVMLSLGSGQLVQGGAVRWIQLALMLVSFGSMILSTYFGVRIFAPIMSRKQRDRVMDLRVTEHNLFLFLKIAEFTKSGYRRELDELSKEEILEQYVSQAHNLSRLLVVKYQNIQRAHLMFLVALVSFSMLAIIAAVTS